MRFIAKSLLVIIFLGAAGTAWLWSEYQSEISNPIEVLGGRATYVIKPGDNLSKTAYRLAEQNIIRQPLVLIVYGRAEKLAGSIRAGEYEITSGLTIPELMERFVRGRVVQHSLALVEGWNFKQLLAVVAASPHLEHTLAGKSHEEVMSAIGHAGMHPEGRFFPDTYKFPSGTTDVGFLRRAYKVMDEFLEKEWQGRAPSLPYKSKDEALVMASIVEKETGVPEERGLIAGVFVRRLNKGMRLETDPTVIYGLGDAFDGNLRRSDLRRETPYNTYVRFGLPPTPIATPSAAAVQAAMHPLPTKALFFVAKGDGSHQFSATYAEHRKAVRKYQLRR